MDLKIENSTGPGVEIPSFVFQICLFLSEWAWGSHLTFLSLGVSMYEKNSKIMVVRI